MKMLAKILKNASIILFWVAAALFGIFLLVNFVLIFIPGKDLILPANLSGSFSGSLNGIFIFIVNPQTNGNIMIKPVLQALFLWLTVGTAMVAVILLFLTEYPDREVEGWSSCSLLNTPTVR